MARIGNEARLILKLVRERVHSDLGRNLQAEITWRMQVGNRFETITPQAALEIGYYKAISDYDEVIRKLLAELEAK
jgi:hypothetical protein